MGSYLEWASANPTKTEEYQELKQSLTHVEEEILQFEQALQDIENGIMPDEKGTTFTGALFKNFSFSDVFLRPSALKRTLYGTDAPLSEAEIQADEDFLADSKRTRFNESLLKEKDKALRRLNGWTDDFTQYGAQHIYVNKGLYAEREEARKALEEYQPRDYKKQWVRYDRQSAALNQRLQAFGWTGDCASETGDIITLVPYNMYESFWDIGFKFSLSYGTCWVATCGDNTVSFTRLTWGEDPIDAIQRALLSFIDARWDDLISKV